MGDLSGWMNLLWGDLFAAWLMAAIFWAIAGMAAASWARTSRTLGGVIGASTLFLGTFGIVIFGIAKRQRVTGGPASDHRYDVDASGTPNVPATTPPGSPVGPAAQRDSTPRDSTPRDSAPRDSARADTAQPDSPRQVPAQRGSATRVSASQVSASQVSATRVSVSQDSASQDFQHPGVRSGPAARTAERIIDPRHRPSSGCPSW